MDQSPLSILADQISGRGVQPLISVHRPRQGAVALRVRLKAKGLSGRSGRQDLHQPPFGMSILEFRAAREYSQAIHHSLW